MALVIGVSVACTDTGPPRQPAVASLTIHSGDEQGAEVEDQLGGAARGDRARSAAGEPVAGVEVVWNALQSGSVAPAQSVTGGDCARLSREVMMHGEHGVTRTKHDSRQ